MGLCAECLKPLTPGELENAFDKGEGIICDVCEHYNHCWWCGLDYEEECEMYESETVVSSAFVVFNEVVMGVPRGIYKILRHPFFCAGSAGAGGIWPHCVERIWDVPEETVNRDGKCIAMLCRVCEEKYFRLAAEASREGKVARVIPIGALNYKH